MAMLFAVDYGIAAPAKKTATKPRTTAKKPPVYSGAASSESAIANSWLKSLTPRERIAQLFVIPFSGQPVNTHSKEYRKFVHLVSQEHVGGLILVNVTNGRLVAKADPLEVASFLNRMQKLAKVPLLVSGDFERGASMRLESTTLFPHAMAFTAGRDPNAAKVEGEITARESRAVGVQWLFFPVADVNNNPDNPVINIRSFGENPQDVAAYVDAFIEGAHSVPGSRVLTTAKHFPGHGDTATDSHINMAAIPGDRARLDQVEFVPFKSAIKAGVDSIMTAHLAVPALDSPDTPATLSTKILSGVLRDELNFKGIIVTDALEMGGIAKGFSNGEASIRALESGADVLLMPPDPEAAIDAVAAALKKGRITQARIDNSVRRILLAKAHVGLHKRRLVDLEEIHTVVNSPESVAAAQQIADRAVTLLRNDGAFFPLKSARDTVFVVMTEGRAAVQGLAFTAELRKRIPNANLIQLDSTLSDADLQQALQRATAAGRIVVAAYASVASYRGNLALGGGYPAFVKGLVDSKKPVALISLGNPYLWRAFPEVAAYMTTYTPVPTGEIAAVKALWGDITIGGKLPVTIPGLAQYGDGIAVSATPAKP